MVFLRLFASSSVDPIVCWTNLSSLSTFPNSFTATAPKAATGAVIPVVMAEPTLEIVFPAFWVALPSADSVFWELESFPNAAFMGAVNLSVSLRTASMYCVDILTS